MSFISRHLNLFRDKKENVSSRYRSTGRLKNASSCTDTRACSLDPKIQREYFMESFDISPSSSDEGIHIDKPRKTQSSGNLLQEQYVTKLKYLLMGADNKIGELTLTNSKLWEKNQEYTDEVTNLRCLIKDLQEQINHLETLKVENSNLRSERGSDFKTQFLKAENEMAHLLKELNVYQGIKEKYEELRYAHDQLKTEHNIVSHTLSMIKEEKSKLAIQCNIQKGNLDKWKSKGTDILSIINDKNLLRENLQQKEEQISNLCDTVASQEMSIEQLNEEIQKMSDTFEWKENMLKEHIESLQNQLAEKTAQITDLESQVAMTKLAVSELESLREQFRCTNSDLNENIVVFRNQFMNMLESSNNLIETVESLKKELDEKNKELEEVKLFPHTTKSKFYFKALNRLLNSPKLTAGIGDSVNLKKIFSSIKSIVNCLKRDLWVSMDSSSLLIELTDSTSQTMLTNENATCQREVVVNCTSSQTVYWDDHLARYNQALKEIETLSKKNISLAKINEMQTEVSSKLKNEIGSSQQKLEDRDAVILALKNCNSQLYDHVLHLNDKLKSSDEFLHEALVQLDCDSEIRTLSQEQFENLLVSTINEYETYICVLETCLESKQQNLNQANQLLENEKNSEIKYEEELKIDKLKQTVDELTLKLQSEKSLANEFKNEVNRLISTLNKKTKYISAIEEKLAMAEKIANNLISEICISCTNELELLENDPSNITSTKKEIILKVTMILNQYKDKLITQGVVENSNIKQNCKKEWLQKQIKFSNLQKARLQQKVFQMYSNKKRVRNIICILRKRMGKSERLIQELQTISELLNNENNHIKTENISLTEEIEELKEEIKRLEQNLEIEETSKNQLLEIKSKLEKMIIDLLRKLTKYKKMAKINKDKEFTDGDTQTEIDYQLSRQVEILKTENMSLLMVISDLKSTIFNKTENKNVYIQVNSEVDTIEKKDDIVKMKAHYETIIQTLCAEHNSEIEQAQKQHAINLKMLQENYEKEKLSSKRSHAEKLLKLQSFHDKEIDSVKEENSLKQEKLEKEIADKDAKYQLELKSMKDKYEMLLKQKEELFTTENEMLKIRLVKVILEKDSQLDHISSEMALNFQNLKNKCKINVKRLKDKHRADLDKIVKLCKHELIKVMRNEGSSKQHENKMPASSGDQPDSQKSIKFTDY